MTTHQAPFSPGMSSSAFASSYGTWQTNFFDVYPFDEITVLVDFASLGTAANFTFAILNAPSTINKVTPAASWPHMKVENAVGQRDEVVFAVGDIVNSKLSFTIKTKGMSRIAIQGKSSDGTGTASITYVLGSGPVALPTLQPGA